MLANMNTSEMLSRKYFTYRAVTKSYYMSVQNKMEMKYLLYQRYIMSVRDNKNLERVVMHIIDYDTQISHTIL